MAPVSARRTIALSLALPGRATRTELANYLLVAMFVALAISFVSGLFASYELRLLIRNALALILAVPVPALLVRRLHDLGRSGTLAWLAVPGIALWALRTVISMASGIEARIGFDGWAWPLDWIVILTNLALVILVILPGTTGANRFGSNPREASGKLFQHTADRLDPGA